MVPWLLLATPEENTTHREGTKGIYPPLWMVIPAIIGELQMSLATWSGEYSGGGVGGRAGCWKKAKQVCQQRVPVDVLDRVQMKQQRVEFQHERSSLSLLPSASVFSPNYSFRAKYFATCINAQPLSREAKSLTD
jgi:hypothetical protein